MKKILIVTLISLLAIFGLVACGSDSTDEGTYTEDAASELTLYANGGALMMGDPPTEVDLGVYTVDPDLSFGEGIDEYIDAVEKEDAEFAGWKIYAVNDGEWVSEEVTDLADGQECVSCGDYGYYLMNDYEVLYEAATTEKMQSCKADGRDYYAVAVWE